MAAISERFGQGGVGLQPGHGDPDLATVLRDIADDLGTLVGAEVTATVGAALGAFTDPPSAGEMSTLRTRVNELITAVGQLKTAQNAREGATLLTTKA